MPECCGRDAQSNFCPSCGKAMDSRAGLRGLLRYVTAEFAKAEKKAKGWEEEWDSDLARAKEASNAEAVAYWQREANRTGFHARKARQKASQWKDWQEALIKAIDG